MHKPLYCSFKEVFLILVYFFFFCKIDASVLKEEIQSNKIFKNHTNAYYIGNDHIPDTDCKVCL